MGRKWVALIIGLVIVLGFVINPIVLQTEEKEPKEKPNTKEQVTKEQKNSSELQAKIKELIKQLGDTDWKTREDSQQELLKIGKPMMYPLVDAIDSTDDIEIKLRSITILSQLDIELSDEEVTQLEKRIEKSKDGNKDTLWQALGKWLGTPVRGFQFTIRSDKKAYKLGANDKITIEFRFTNLGKEDIYMCKEFYWAPYFYEITGPEGVVQSDTCCYDSKGGQGQPPLTRNDFALLNSEKSYAVKIFGKDEGGYRFWLAHTEEMRDTWILSKPGKYQIKIKYGNKHNGKNFGLKAWTGEVTSNTITIEIKDKEGK